MSCAICCGFFPGHITIYLFQKNIGVCLALYLPFLFDTHAQSDVNHLTLKRERCKMYVCGIVVAPPPPGSWKIAIFNFKLWDLVYILFATLSLVFLFSFWFLPQGTAVTKAPPGSASGASKHKWKEKFRTMWDSILWSMDFPSRE